MIGYPEIDPVFFRIGPLAFRWYGLMYILGFFFGFRFAKVFLRDRFGLDVDQALNFFTCTVLGVLLGGRLGYVLFYKLPFYLDHPSQILSVWEGGMSYHGGAIGAVAGVYLFSQRHRVSFLGILDLLGISSTFGLFFGRIGNFINGELYGRVSNVPWAMIFPTGGPLARHPSQLYQAFFEGIVLFGLLYFLLRCFKLKNGILFSVYLMAYGGFRFFLEYFREPDAHLGFVVASFSMGQLLCGSMILMGAALFWWIQTRELDPLS